MNTVRARDFLLALPHVAETMQWGDNLVFWAADKAIGGKMFAVLDLGTRGVLSSTSRSAVISFAAGPELYPDLLEIEGVAPAPYLARAHWVAVERWDVFRPSQWEQHLRHAHSFILGKLPPRTRTVLHLPAHELRQLIASRRRLVAAQKAAKA